MVELKEQNAKGKIKKLVNKIIKEDLHNEIKLWEETACKFLTRSFLTDFAFKLKKTEKHKNTYLISNMYSYSLINELPLVKDYLSSITGRQNKINKKPETYYIELFNEIYEKIIEAITIKLIQQSDEMVDNNDIAVVLSYKSNRDKLMVYIVNLIDNLSELDFKKIIDKYHLEVKHSMLDESAEEDAIDQRNQIKRESYLLIENDLFNYLGVSDLSVVKEQDVELLLKINDWVKDKLFSELLLIEEFFPFHKNLINYKWLNEDIYNNVIKNRLQNIEQINLAAIKANMDVCVDLPVVVNQVYSLYKKITEIKNSKDIYFVFWDKETNCSLRKTFKLDKFNRIIGLSNDGELIRTLYKLFNETGYVFIRADSARSLKIKRGNLSINRNKKNIYGVSVMEREKGDFIVTKYLDSSKVELAYSNFVNCSLLPKNRDGDSFCSM